MVSLVYPEFDDVRVASLGEIVTKDRLARQSGEILRSFLSLQMTWKDVHLWHFAYLQVNDVGGQARREATFVLN